MEKNNLKRLAELKPRTFNTTVIRNITNEIAGGTLFQPENFKETDDNFILNDSSSFRLDPYGTGLKSTQQLNVDWSVFDNHVFFHSAQVKTNAAFEKIQNYFPIDGTKKEFQKFFDGLTGFEKYVYDSYPKYLGYLFLSGSSTPGYGTVVTVKDIAGSTYPGITRKPDGTAILNPNLKSETFESWMYFPSQSNGNSIIAQKLNVSSSGLYYGFTLSLSQSTSPLSGVVGFTLNSGSYTLHISASVSKSVWNHFAVVWDRNQTELRTKVFINKQLVTQSAQVDIGFIPNDGALFYIGSGSTFPCPGPTSTFIPQETLSGALKDFRVWHKAKSALEIEAGTIKPLYAQDDLVLSFRFNEPSGSNSAIVIDSSGKGAHGTLSTTGVATSIRNIATGSIAGRSPVTYEKYHFSPVLMPDHPEIETLRQEFLLSASLYDQQNPSLIVKLVPAHYFLEGQIMDNLETEYGSIETTITSSSSPKSTKMGDTQVLLMILYSWASFFDELKLFVDAFADSIHVDYDMEDTIPDQFLPMLARKFGIDLPPLFVGSSILQYIDGDNIDDNPSLNDYGLQYVQNQIWRRILTNVRDFVSSKGTIHSVKSFIRSTGIDPDNNFRIREYGGPTFRSIGTSRERRSESSTMLSFISGGLVKSGYLSGSRKEPGLPYPVGTFSLDSNGRRSGTSNASDGLFTSGSWTYEAIYKLTSSGGDPQSLARLHFTGSARESVAVNLIARNDEGVTAYFRPNADTSSAWLSMSLTNFNPMDGNLWNISFGRDRGDLVGFTSLSSSYFLRAARNSFGEIVEEYTTSSLFNENVPAPHTNNLWNNISATLNASGAFIAIGSQSLTVGSVPLLNDDSGTVPAEARTTRLTGKVSQIRFWSKGLTQPEWREHVRNFKSLGVVEPDTNFNFEYNNSGSFQRLRLDASTDQQVFSASSAGRLDLFDFSQNNLHFTGSSFSGSFQAVVPQVYYYSYLSPYFDEAVTTNKVRVRSYNNPDNLYNDENYYAETTPIHELRRSEQPTDNNRFAIDFSIVDTLNEDIISMFGTLEEMDNSIGDPALMFSPDYPSLEALRGVYFNRLSERMNLKSFFEFYKWFDNNIGNYVTQLLPKRTRFAGTRFIISSHMLERSKLEYNSYEQYLGDSSRNQRDTLLLQFFVGTLKRY